MVWFLLDVMSSFWLQDTVGVFSKHLWNKGTKHCMWGISVKWTVWSSVLCLPVPWIIKWALRTGIPIFFYIIFLRSPRPGEHGANWEISGKGLCGIPRLYHQDISRWHLQAVAITSQTARLAADERHHYWRVVLQRSHWQRTDRQCYPTHFKNGACRLQLSNNWSQPLRAEVTPLWTKFTVPSRDTRNQMELLLPGSLRIVTVRVTKIESIFLLDSLRRNQATRQGSGNTLPCLSSRDDLKRYGAALGEDDT